MKKQILVFLLLLVSLKLFPQNYPPYYYTNFREIVDLFHLKEYHEAIVKMDTFLLEFPIPDMYYNRGLTKVILNDINGARTDLSKAKELGYDGKEDFINSITSKKYMVDMLTKNYIQGVQLNPAKGFKPDFSLKDSLRGALSPERTCFDIYYYNLTVKIIPQKKMITGENQIYFTMKEKSHVIQVDLTANFKIESIKWNGQYLKYTRVFDAVFINFDQTLPVNQKQMILISYSGIPRVAPNPPWDGGFIWKKKRFNHWIGVACEHLGASSWWPCKDHLSDKPDSMCINIQVPNGYQAVANGNLRSIKKIDDTYSNFEWFVSYPINSYGVTFYMGKFVNFNEVYSNKNGSYNIDYYVLKHHFKDAKKYYSQTKDIVKVYEKLYGEYPYFRDGIAMVEAPYAGMEHQSAIAIGDEYGKRERRNYENKDYDYLVVHETAHEWWGNTVTMGDMADAWISEGFATYTEHLFMEEKFGYKEYLSASAKNMQRIYNIWPIVGLRDVNDNSFLGGDIYHKGAAMLNNLRCDINNDTVFFGMIKGFYNARKFKISTSADFTNFVNAYTHKDYTDFFKVFYYQTEPPILEYSFTNRNDTLSFSYKWQNVGANFTMPFSITTNTNINYRLVGTANKQVITIAKVKSFSLPNENNFQKEEPITKNSLTYYWTFWKH
jgi:aminopeptidase N